MQPISPAIISRYTEQLHHGQQIMDILTVYPAGEWFVPSKEDFNTCYWLEELGLIECKRVPYRNIPAAHQRPPSRLDHQITFHLHKKRI